MRPLNYFDWFVLSGCLAIALFHITGIFVTFDISPWWRHLLFACICWFIAYAWIKQFAIQPYFIALLFIQQCTTHGVSVIRTWNDQHKIDWKSVVILLLLIILFIRSLTNKKHHTISV
jgi:uncharacterized membrane protein YfcA